MAYLGFPSCRLPVCRAALHILNDDLGNAHRIVQDVEDADGYLLHAILHRREGDWENARYWFARTGDHPAYERVYRAALGAWSGVSEWGRWRPERFVDMVREAEATGRLYSEAVMVQSAELHAVLEDLLDKSRG